MKTDRTRKLPPFFTQVIGSLPRPKVLLDLLTRRAEMGVVDVRSASLQEVEQIEAIGAAGAEIIDPKQIALNPDCGFAPGAGEPPTIDEAFEKLSRLSKAAARLRKRFA